MKIETIVDRTFRVFFLSLGLGLVWTTLVFVLGTPLAIPEGARFATAGVLLANGGINFAIMRRSAHPWFRVLRPLNIVGTILGLSTLIAPVIAVPIVRLTLVLYCIASAERAFSGVFSDPIPTT